MACARGPKTIIISPARRRTIIEKCNALQVYKTSHQNKTLITLSKFRLAYHCTHATPISTTRVIAMHFSSQPPVARWVKLLAAVSPSSECSYEGKAGVVYLQVIRCDPHLSA